MTGTPTPVRLAGVQAGSSLFDMLGVRPMLGRVFTEDDERASLTPDGERVVVLAYPTWRSYFGSDPDVIGTTTILNGRQHRIIGVMPEGFGFPSIAEPDALTSTGALADAPEFWMPLGLRPSTPRGGMVPTTYALLNDGYSPEAAAAELTTIVPARLYDSARYPVDVVDLRDEAARDRRQALWMFQAGVTLILLIACVNVVNLLQARAAQKYSEVWVRFSLGASRLAVVRFSLTESLLLTAAGSVLGVAIAYALVGAVRGLPAYVIPRVSEVRVDVPVLLFTAAVAIGSGLAVGLVSVLRTIARRPDLQPRATAKRPSPALVVVEVAGAVLLLVAGGLLVNSSVNLSRVDIGIRPERALVFRINVPAVRYADRTAREALYDAVTTRLRAIPTVESVGMSVNGSVAETSGIRWPMIVGGRDIGQTFFRDVSPGYFESLGIPILAGRGFTMADRADQLRTIVVNEAFARAHFGRTTIVGEHLTFGDDKDLEIVGVTGDVRAATTGDGPAHTAGMPPQVYLPAAYLAGTRAVGIVRTSGAPMAVVSSVRAAIADIDANLVVFDVQPLADRVERSIVAWRLYAAVSTGFAILAVLLAAIGLYGVLTHSVGLRTREFGIRTALGARPAVLLSSVMSEGLMVTAFGIALGLGGALLTTRLLETLLFGVTPLDSSTFAAVAILFVTIGALACYLPARRATRVDPVVALRAE
jgi:predicted permease